MNAAVSPSEINNFMHVHDAKHPRRWLSDSGSSVSAIPPSDAQRAKGPSLDLLMAANGTQINCYGRQKLDVNLADRTYKFELVVADVTQPILGSDFLAHHYLAPNHRDR